MRRIRRRIPPRGAADTRREELAPARHVANPRGTTPIVA
jgi:hypothetical protein